MRLGLHHTPLVFFTVAVLYLRLYHSTVVFLFYHHHDHRYLSVLIHFYFQTFSNLFHFWFTVGLVPFQLYIHLVISFSIFQVSAVCIDNVLKIEFFQVLKVSLLWVFYFTVIFGEGSVVLHRLQKVFVSFIKYNNLWHLLETWLSKT